MPHITSNTMKPQRYFYYMQHQIKPPQDISLVRGLYTPLNYAAPLCKAMLAHETMHPIYKLTGRSYFALFTPPTPGNGNEKLSPTTSLLLVTKQSSIQYILHGLAPVLFSVPEVLAEPEGRTPTCLTLYCTASKINQEKPLHETPSEFKGSILFSGLLAQLEIRKPLIPPLPNVT